MSCSSFTFDGFPGDHCPQRGSVYDFTRLESELRCALNDQAIEPFGTVSKQLRAIR
jgi:hypothetical protein